MCTTYASQGGTTYRRSFNCGLSEGADSTGDGKAEVLCSLSAFGGPYSPPDPGRVFLIHGAESLPPTLESENVSAYATILTSTDPADEFGDGAFLAGDMNGDGTSELVLQAGLAGRVYVLFGGEIAKGEVTVQSLLAAGRGFVVEGCPWGFVHVDASYPSTLTSAIPLGDLNGDGLKDSGMNASRAPGFGGGGELRAMGSLVIVLGSPRFPPVLEYTSLPRIDPPRSPAGGDDAYFSIANRVGDVDGDGFDDVFLLSMSYAPITSAETQKNVVFFGRRVLGGRLAVDDELASGGAAEGFVLPTVEGWGWGLWADGVGDQNGDGKDDLIVHYALQNPGTPTFTAARRLFYGRSRQEFAVPRDLRIESAFDATVFVPTAGVNDDIVVSQGGRDLNGDGWPDILVDDDHYPEPGSRAIAVFGGNLERKAGPLSQIRECYQLIDYSVRGEPDFYGYGLYYYFGGDVNGDGYEDTVAARAGAITIYFNPLGALKRGRAFVRGDVNQDRTIDIADAISALQFPFAHGRILPCMDAGDANDDEQLNIADAIRILSHLFGSGAKPPLPPPTSCGNDPNGDTLDCRESVCR